MDRELEKYPQKSSAPRFVLVDAFRFICAGWVMWVHIPQSAALEPTANWMRFRLPFFVVLAVFFQQYQMARRPVGDFWKYALERVRRLYLPFLAWGTLYFLAEGVHHVLTGRSWPALTPEFFLQGTTIHLWFIPFILLVGLATYPLARALVRKVQHRQWARGVIGMGGLLGIAGCLAAKHVLSHALAAVPNTNPVYWEVQLIPCVPLGFAVFFLYMELRGISEKSKQGLHGLAAALVATGFLANVWLFQGPLTQNLVGACMVALALRPAKGVVWSVLARWGKYSFGMYAVQMFFVEFMHVLRESILHLPATWWFDLLTLAVCVPASLLTTIVLCRHPATRWMVPIGEKSSTEKAAWVLPSTMGELHGISSSPPETPMRAVTLDSSHALELTLK